jgi:hypothetical protein
MRAWASFFRLFDSGDPGRGLRRQRRGGGDQQHAGDRRDDERDGRADDRRDADDERRATARRAARRAGRGRGRVVEHGRGAGAVREGDAGVRRRRGVDVRRDGRVHRRGAVHGGVLGRARVRGLHPGHDEVRRGWQAGVQRGRDGVGGRRDLRPAAGARVRRAERVVRRRVREPRDAQLHRLRVLPGDDAATTTSFSRRTRSRWPSRTRRGRRRW